MAHYQYNGLHFELPDGLSNEQALSKIKTHLGETEAKKQEPSIGDKLIAGTKQMAASAVNTMDTGVSLAASLPARMFQGQEAQEEIFKNLNTRTAGRNWGEGIDPGVVGKVAGAVATLPAQMLAMGLSPAQTGKTALDLGESLPTALKAAGIDAAGNAVGMLLPGAVGVSKAAKVASGAGINAAQEALTKVGIQGLMETQQGKKTFAPTLEDTLVSGIVGGGFGAMHKTKAPKTSSAKKDIEGAVKREAAITAPATEYKQPIQPDPSSQRWERAVADLGGEILPKETPFSGMVDTLSGNPRVIEPEFKMAPEVAPYVKGAGEAARDDATAARLQAAVDRQNPRQSTIAIGKEGDAFSASAENFAARDRAEQIQLSALDQHVQDPFTQMVDLLTPKETPKAEVTPVDPFEQIKQQALEQGDHQRYAQAQAAIDARQKQLEFETARKALLDKNAAEAQRQQQAPSGYDNWVAQQRQAAEQRLPGNNDPLNFNKENAPYSLGDAPYQYKGGLDFTQHSAEDMQAPVIRSMQEKAAWEQRSKEQLAESARANAQEAKQQAQEGALQPLEERLRREAYQPPTQEDLRAGHLSGRSPRIGKFGQGGSAPMFNDIAEGIISLGKGIRAKYTGNKAVAPDSIDNPISPDTIARKEQLANKQRALGINDPVYQNIKTVEEAVTNPGKDIGPIQDLASGPEGVIRRNKTNKPINFIRTMGVKARWATDALVRQYITGKDGLNNAIRELSTNERLEVAELITELSHNKVDYSARLADDLDLSPAQRAFMEKRAASFKEVKRLMDEYNSKNGFELVDSLGGYAPSLFSSQYASVVYKIGKDSAGKETRTVVGVANGRSKGEWELAKKYFEDKGYKVEQAKRNGLRTSPGFGREMDGTLQMLREMAEQDPRFAELQQGLEVLQRESAKKLYGLNVHEMHKKGVEGAVGEKPWRNAEQNSRERLEAEINFLDQAFKYWSYQDFITQAKTLVDNPAIAEMTNTRKYISDHIKHVTGVNLHPIGAMSNWVVDTAFKMAGQGAAKAGVSMPENPQKVASVVRDTFSAIAMNVYAPLFAAINLVQPLTGGLPEAARIRGATGISPHNVVFGLGKAAALRTAIFGMEQSGVDLSKTKIPQHMIDAYHFMKSHAMDTFNEAQMSHEGAQNPKLQKAKQAAFWPTVIPEMATRPTTFMWFVDMFHKGGLRGDELMMTAYNATEHAMVGYHPDQRPMLYSKLGMYGTMTGQLKTFGHNSIENMIARTKEAKKYPAAFTTMVALAVGLGGLSGLPGFDQLDEWIVQPLTGKSALRHMQSLPPELVHGAASAYSGLDWQSRFSMAGTIPNDVKDLMGASVSKMTDMMGSAYTFLQDGDVASFNQLVKSWAPSGAYGAYEDAQLTTTEGFVLDKEGQIKYDQPRTERERKIRAVLGLRPLRERLEDTDIYQRDKQWAKMTDKERDQARKMKAANNFGDYDAFWIHYDKYKELGGDPTIVQDLFEEAMKKANISNRQRKAGVPSDSLNSIRKYKHYTEE